MELFTCKMCGFEKEYEDAPAKCPKCDRAFYRITFLKESRRKNIKGVNWYEKDNVRYSYSLGCQPHERASMAKIHPGAEFTPDGRMIIHNRAEKKRRMKERGYYEYA